jgi:hypothetical protein
MDLFRLDQPRSLGRDPSGGYAVDIIAIHGLNGHYERTWTDQPTGRLWLRDLLPFDIPGARIFSFSYDSRIFTDTVMTIGDYALKLLGSISSERSTDEVIVLWMPRPCETSTVLTGTLRSYVDPSFSSAIAWAASSRRRYPANTTI